jgi:hypothetical protein
MAERIEVNAGDVVTVERAKSQPVSGRPVLVCTEHRGVFFGYADSTDGDVIKLERGRNCIYWPASAKGFLGLANTGPVSGSRVGPPADIELRKITCVAEVTPAAVALWEAQPWA